MNKTEAINKMIATASVEVGYLEKASNSNLDSKTGNAGYGNYTKYWRDTAPQYQGQPWCADFVTWALEKSFGKENAKKLLKHYPYIYVPTLMDLFSRNANPEVGDIVCFYRNGEFAHTGIVTKVNDDYFETIEGNTSGASGIVANGGGVCKKSYYNSQLPGTKFARLDWSIVSDANSDKTTVSANNLVQQAQRHLNNVLHQNGSLGGEIAEDNIKGPATVKSTIMLFQYCYNLDKKGNLEVDGVIGTNTRAAIAKVELKKGCIGYLASFLEIALMVHGYDPKGVEWAGEIGSGCYSALVQFQKDKGYYGGSVAIAGKTTITDLLK